MARETCALCGLTYMPDHEVDRVAHARRHGLILLAHNPEPEEKFLDLAFEKQRKATFRLLRKSKVDARSCTHSLVCFRGRGSRR